MARSLLYGHRPADEGTGPEVNVKHRLLLADDNALFLRLTRDFLTRENFLVETATSGREALEKVRSMPSGYSVAVIDYRMADQDGAQVAREICRINSNLYVVMYSADSSRDALLATWQSGAVEFVDKSADPENFLATVRRWCHKYEETHLTVQAPEPSESSKLIASIGLVGFSNAMVKVALDVKSFRSKRANVLILGESGTGKEKIARALHDGSRHTFRAVNCASYNGDTSLMEAELFGADRGAYTGADRERRGIFEDANGGTVFLDEIHTLSISAQQKLLRTLQERTVRPLGKTQEIPVNFRLVAAAKPDLEERARRGEFLPDLFYRLYVLSIDVPTLRDRPEDVAPLVAHFAQRYSDSTSEKKVFLARTVRYMERYRWPGNVRELEHTVERLCSLTPGDKIAPEHLDSVFFDQRNITAVAGDASLQGKLDEFTRDQMEEALQAVGTIRGAARRLGIPHSTFHDLMKRFDLKRPPKKLRRSIRARAGV